MSQNQAYYTSAPQHAAPVYQQVAQGRATWPEKEYNSKLGDCSCCKPASTCCLAFWCPCILYGKLTELARVGVMSGDQVDNCALNGFIWFCAAQLIGSIGTGIMGLITRPKIEEKYNLKRTGGAKTFCCHCCCPCVILTQEYKAAQELEPLYQSTYAVQQAAPAPQGVVYAQPVQQPGAPHQGQ